MPACNGLPTAVTMPAPTESFKHDGFVTAYSVKTIRPPTWYGASGEYAIVFENTEVRKLIGNRTMVDSLAAALNGAYNLGRLRGHIEEQFK